jgi:hypothetical protein
MNEKEEIEQNWCVASQYLDIYGYEYKRNSIYVTSSVHVAFHYYVVVIALYTTDFIPRFS